MTNIKIHNYLIESKNHNFRENFQILMNWLFFQGGYQMVRSGSAGYMDDGYVPDYHTGRKMSASQYEVIFQGHILHFIFCQTGKIDSFSNEKKI